jgi:hypothetical protein
MIILAVKNLEDLKIALEALSNQNLTRIPAEEVLVATQHFSERFECNMQMLISKAGALETREPDRMAQPARLRLFSHKRMLAAAIIMAILISLFSITAAREAVFSFFVQVYEKFSTIVFNRDPAETTPTPAPSAGIDDIDALLPTFIPEGYKLSDKLVTQQFANVDYRNTRGDLIVLTIQRLNMTQLMIDTEDTQKESVKIAQYDGLYYSNKGSQTVIWQNGPNVFMITGKLDKETLIKMAESIK